MDRDGNGFLEFEDMVGVYDASKHPEFIKGKKTERQVFEEFLRTF